MLAGGWHGDQLEGTQAGPEGGRPSGSSNPGAAGRLCGAILCRFCPQRSRGLGIFIWTPFLQWHSFESRDICTSFVAVSSLWGLGNVPGEALGRGPRERREAPGPAAFSPAPAAPALPCSAHRRVCCVRSLPAGPVTTHSVLHANNGTSSSSPWRRGGQSRGSAGLDSLQGRVLPAPSSPWGHQGLLGCGRIAQALPPSSRGLPCVSLLSGPLSLDEGPP